MGQLGQSTPVLANCSLYSIASYRIIHLKHMIKHVSLCDTQIKHQKVTAFGKLTHRNAAVICNGRKLN